MHLAKEAEIVLREAGWAPGRRVDVEHWRLQFESGDIAMHPAAEEFLSEFGGLAVDVRGPGVTAAREPFHLDPAALWGEEDRFLDWSESVGKSIYPLGELSDGRFFLGIDQDGVVYLVADWLARFGPWPEALEKLVLGYAPDEVHASG